MASSITNDTTSITTAMRSPRGSRSLRASMTISSGVISVPIGMLPAMKMTEPYSPMPGRTRGRSR